MEQEQNSSFMELHQSNFYQSSAAASVPRGNKKLEEISEKNMVEVYNDIEQEVSLLLKTHYMFELNIKMPSHVINFQEQQEKELYLQVFQDKRKLLNKRIDETNKQMEQLIKLQAQLYEASLIQQYTSTSLQRKNQRIVLEQCKKSDIAFTSTIERLTNQSELFQLYINHYNSQLANKLKSTYHSESIPVSIQQEEQSILKNTIIDGIEDKEIGASIEEIKEVSNAFEFSSSSSKNKAQNQANSTTQLVTTINPNETIMTRRKVQQYMSNSIQEISDNISITSGKNEITPPIKKQNQTESQNGGERKVSTYIYNSIICLDPYQNAKTQYNEKMRAHSFQNNQKSNSNSNNQQMQTQSSQQQQQQESQSNTTKQNKGYFYSNSTPGNISDNINGASKEKAHTNSSNEKSKSLNPPSKQIEEIIIKSDYEENQERFKNIHLQLKQLSEKFTMILEEFEHIIYLLKVYLLNFCIKNGESKFQEVSRSTSSQIEKCLNFLDAQQNYEEQISFIQNQYLHFPVQTDLTISCQASLRKKLKVSKQILYENQNEESSHEKDEQQYRNNFDENANNSFLEENEASISTEDSQNKKNCKYIHSIKQFYEPHSNIKEQSQSLQETIKNNISFEQKFYEDSQNFYDKFKGCKALSSMNINTLLKKEDSLKKLFSI